MTTHEQWVNKANAKVKTDKSNQFKETTKCIYCRYSFINLLRNQTGRNGVPFIYMVKDNDAPITSINTKSLDDYIDKAPHIEEDFSPDAADVHT